jgi:hypothetical protein
MKKTILFFTVLIFSALNLSAQNGMTDVERKAAVKHLKESQAYMMKTIKGLSEAQLNFKPNAESWSIRMRKTYYAI